MKKLACSLLTIIILFTISCEIGLGSSVDTDPPSLEISADIVDTTIAGDFNIEGTYSDDGNIAGISAVLKRTDGFGSDILIEGTLEEDIKKRGTGIWKIPVNAKTDNIIDGPYQITVSIKDAMGRITTQSTTFTIDNTPPVLILTKPNSKPGDDTVSAYGQRIFLEGSIADSAKETKITVEFYDNENCVGDALATIPTGAISPTDVNSNNARLAVYTDTDDLEKLYNKIYNPVEENGKEGSKDIYIRITASDIAGNETTDFYFSKDLGENLTKDKKSNGYGLAPIDIYTILNGTDNLKNSARSTTDVTTIKSLLAESKKEIAMFSLNPANSPYFTIAGMKTITGDKDFESSDKGYFVINGAQTLEISVFMGSDSIELVDDKPNTPVDEREFYAYVLECEENGTPKADATPIKLYSKSKETGTGSEKKTYYSIGGKQGHKTTSGAYVFTIPMAESLIPDPDIIEPESGFAEEVETGLEVGKNYRIYVHGKDNEDNEIESYETGYGFHFSSGGGAPTLEIEEPADTTAIYKKGDKVKFKGTVKSGEGIPEVTLWKSEKGKDDVKIDDIPLLTEYAGKENAFEYEIPAEKFNQDESGIYSIKIMASRGEGVTTLPYSIWYDVKGPAITINSKQPVVTVKKADDTSEECINGIFTVKGTIIDDIDQVETAVWKVKQGDEVISGIGGELTNSFDFSVNTNLKNEAGESLITDNENVKIIIEATDRAGNVNTESLTYKVDQSTDKPAITNSSDALDITKGTNESLFDQSMNMFVRGSSLVLGVSDDDGVKEAEVILQLKDSNGNFAAINKSEDSETYSKWTNPSVITHTIPTEVGVYKVTVIAKDKYFDTTATTPYNYTEVTFMIKVTGTGPDVTITPEKDYVSTLNSAATNKLTFKVNGATTTDKFKLYKVVNGTPVIQKTSDNKEERTSPFDYTLEFDQGTTPSDEITFRITDANGFTNKIFTPKFDNDLPTVSINEFPALIEDTYLFKGTMSDETSGIDSVKIKIGDGAWVDCTCGSSTWNHEAVFTSEGTKTITVKAIDEAGNEYTSPTQSFIYDTSKPNLTVANLTEGKTNTLSDEVTNSGYTLSGTVSDSNALAETNALVVIVDGVQSVVTPTSDGNWSLEIAKGTAAGKLKSDASVNVEVIAKDVADKTTSKSFIIYYDTKKPELEVTSPAKDEPVETAEKAIKGTVRDDGYGVDKVEFTLYKGNVTATIANPEVIQANGTAVTSENFPVTLKGEQWYIADTVNGGKIPLGELQGPLTLKVTATEKKNGTHGGRATTTYVPFYYDVANPSLKETAIGTTGKTTNEGFTFSGKVWDSNAVGEIEIKCDTDNNSWISGTTTGSNITLTPATSEPEPNNWSATFVVGSDNSSEPNYMEDGTHELKIIARDISGKETQLTRVVTVDTVNPQVSGITVTTDSQFANGSVSWYDTRTLSVEVTVTDTGSGVSKVEYTTGTGSNATWAPLSSRDGKYVGSITFADDGANQKIRVKATDVAGNESTIFEETVSIDTTAPELSAMLFKKGANGSITNISGTVCIQNNTSLTFYGNYTDPQSGVYPLTFKFNDVAITGNSIDVTYSTTAINGSNASAVDTLSYVAYDAQTVTAPTTYKSWKAVFTPTASGSLSVSGSNRADNPTSEIKILDITCDTEAPVFSNEKLEEMTGTTASTKKEVYYKDSTSKYYTNNSGKTYVLSGVAADDVGIESVTLQVVNTATTSPATTLTPDMATGATLSKWKFEFPLTDWQTGATATVTVTDKAGRSTNSIYNIVFDTEAPSAKHAVDAKGKDLYFRIGNYDNDDIATTDSMWSNTLDKDSGAKYAGGTYGNAYTINIRGTFEDGEGSDVKKIWYKVYKTGNEILFANSGNEYNLNETQLNTLINDIVESGKSFAPLSSVESKRVFYNVSKEAGAENYGGTLLGDEADYASASYYKYYKVIDSNYNVSLSDFTEGINYLVLVVEDNAGNRRIDSATVPILNETTNETENRTFPCFSLNVDTNPPTITPPSDMSISYTNGGSKIMGVTVQDLPKSGATDSSGVASVKFTYEDNGTKTVNAVYNSVSEKYEADIGNELVNKTSGTFTISAVATDAAGTGNTSTLIVGTIMIDKEGPQLRINSPAAGASVGTTLTISGTASDGNGAGLSSKTSDKITLYATKTANLSTEGNFSNSTDDIATKWVKLGEVATAAEWEFTNVDISNLGITDGENTPFYFMVSGKDDAGTGNLGYSPTRNVIVDRKLPVIQEEPEFTANGSEAWINSNTITLAGSFTDPATGTGTTAIPGSGVNTIYYLVGDDINNKVGIPTTDGTFNTNISLGTSGEGVHLHIWAKDKAGNTLTALPSANTANYKMYTFKVDSNPPTIESKYFQKGSEAKASVDGTVYIKSQTDGTDFVLYGNYADGNTESGVTALTIKNGTTTIPASSITYSTAVLPETAGGTFGSYEAYNAASAGSYKSWKAEFNVNASGRITVEGGDKAGNRTTTITALDIAVDNTVPVVSNVNFTETTGTVTKDVYSTTVGSNVTYFTNNTVEGRTFAISGIATDNVGLQKVSLNIANTATTNTAEPLTYVDNNPTGNWSFTVGGWSGWSTGATATVTVTDKAGNESTASLNIQFDTTAPSLDNTKFKTPTPTETESNLFKFEGLAGSVVHNLTGSGFDKVDIAFTSNNSQPDAAQTTANIASDGSWSSTIEFANISTFNTEGTKYLWVRAYDKAGNVSDEWSSKSFIYDTAAPNIIFTSTTPDANSYENVGFKIEVETPDTNDVATVTASYGSQTNEPLTLTSGKWAKEFVIGSSNSSAANYLADAAYNFTVTVTDTAGKTKSVTRTITVDTTNPSGTFGTTTPSGNLVSTNRWYKVSSIRFAINVTEPNIATVEISKDGSTYESMSGSAGSYAANVTGLSEGPNTVTVKMTDLAGNIGTKTTTVHVDTTEPTLEPTGSSILRYMGTGGFSVSGRAEDAGSGLASLVIKEEFKASTNSSSFAETTESVNSNEPVTVSIGDDGNWTRTLPLGGTVSASGQYRYTLTLKDNAGNETPYQFTTTVDQTAPTLSITNPTNKTGTGAINASPYMFSGSVVEGNEIRAIYYQILSDTTATAPSAPTDPISGSWTGWTSVTPEADWSFYRDIATGESGAIAEGKYKIYMYALDGAGNLSDADSTATGNQPYAREFHVDMAAPVVTANVPEYVNYSTNSDHGRKVTISGTITESQLDTFYIKRNDESGSGTAVTPEEDGSWTYENTPADDGTYSYTFTATDKVGKTNTTLTKTVTVDKAFPTFISSKINDAETTEWLSDKTIKLSGRVSDGTGSGVTSINYKVGNVSRSIPVKQGENATYVDYNTNIDLLEFIGENDSDANLKIWATDAAGNEIDITSAGNAANTYKEYDLQIDSAPPVISSANTVKRINSSPVKQEFNFSVTDSESGIVTNAGTTSAPGPITINVGSLSLNSAVNSNGSKITITADENDTHKWNVTVELSGTDLQSVTVNTPVLATVSDIAGRKSNTTNVGTINVDNVPPVVELQAPTSASNTPGVIYVNKIIELSGNTRDDGGKLDSSVDSILGICYAIANSAPSLPTNEIKGSTSWSAPSGWTVIPGTSKDSTSTSSRWKFTNINTELLSSTPATVFITVAVHDEAGNIGYAEPLELIIDQDTDRPIITLSNLKFADDDADTTYLKSTNSLYISVSDDDGDVEYIKYSLNNGTSWTDYSDGITLPNDGENTVYFKIKDAKEETFETATALQPIIQGKRVTSGVRTISDGVVKLEFNVVTKNPVIDDKVYYSYYDGETWSEFVNTSRKYGGIYSKIKIKIKATSAQGIQSVTATYSGDPEGTEAKVFTSDSVKVNWTSPEIVVGTDTAAKQTISLNVSDKAGMPATKEIDISVDNVPPTLSFTTPIENKLLDWNATIIGSTSETTVYYAVSRVEGTGQTVDDVTPNSESADLLADDDETVLATKWMPVHADTSWSVICDGAESTDSETHTDIVAKYLTEDYLGITTHDAIDAEDEADRFTTVTPVYFWVKAIDECGNKTVTHRKYQIDPQSENPKVNITSPVDENGDHPKLGGTITLRGDTSDNKDDSQYIWIQIDSGTDGFKKSDLTEMKTNCTGQKFGNRKTNLEITDAQFNAITDTNASDYGIMLPLNGRTTWSFQFNDNGKYDPTSGTRNLNITAYATDGDKKCSTAATQVIIIDSDTPYFVESSLELKNYSTNAKQAYTGSNIVKGKWYLTGIVRDTGSGIKGFKYKKNPTDEYTQLISTTGVSYTDTSDPYFWVKAITSSDAEYNAGIDATVKNYRFSIPLGSNESESIGSDSVTIHITEDKQNQPLSSEKTFSLSYDNKAPEFEMADAELSEDVSNTSGFYKFTGKVSEESLTVGQTTIRQTGVKRVAFYFTRDLTYSLKTKDANTYKKHGTENTNDLFDVMLYHSNKEDGSKDEDNNPIDDVDSGNMIVNYNGKVTSGDLTYDSNEGLYWKKHSGSITSNTFTYTGSVDPNIHPKGLIKVNGVIYLIKDVSDLNVEIDSEVSNATSVDAYFAICNVIDNYGEKSTGRESTTKGYGYGYYPKRLKDDGDLITESFYADGTTWNFEAAINSKNLPDGPITIHFVAFDEAGNCSKWDSATNGADVKVGGLALTVKNNAPRIAGMTIGTDQNGNGEVDDEELINLYSNVYSNGYNTLGEETTDVEFPAGIKKVSDLKSVLTVKGKTIVKPELVGGNGKINYSYQVFEHGTGLNWSSSAEYSKEASSDTIIAEGITDEIATLTKPIELLVSDLIGTTNDEDSKQIKDGLFKKFKFSFGDSTPGTTLENGAPNAATLSVLMDVALREENKAKNWILPFYWNGKDDASTLFNTNGALGHIELSKDLPEGTFASDNTDKEYDLDPKVSGKIKIEGIAQDDTLLRDIYVQFNKIMGNGTGSLGSANTVIASYDADNATWTTNSPIGANNAIDSTKGWAAAVQNATYGDLLKVGIITELPKDVEETDRVKYTTQEYGHVVHWILYVDTAILRDANGVIAADKDVRVTATSTDRGTPKWSTTNNGPVFGANTAEVTNFSVTQSGGTDGSTGKDKLSGYYQMDVVPYITSIKTQLSGSEMIPSAQNRSAQGWYAVRRGEDIEISGFNLNANDETNKTKVQINGTDVTPSKFTDANTVYVNITNPENVTLTNGNVDVLVNIGSDTYISSLNNKNADPVFDGNMNCTSIAYNAEQNNRNNDLLTDDRKIYIMDVTRTTQAAELRKVDMVVKDDTLNFSAGYDADKFAYFKDITNTMTATPLRNSFTRYFENRMAMNSDDTIFTVSTCGDTYHQSSGWNKEPSKFALTKGNTNNASEYYSNSKVVYLESNYNGASFNNLDRVWNPDIVVTGDDSETKGYISYYDTTQKLVRFRYFEWTSTGHNLSMYREGNEDTNVTEQAVIKYTDPNDSTKKYNQGFVAIAGSDSNSPYSSVAVDNNGRAIVSWFDAKSKSLKLKYNPSPSTSFSGYQAFSQIPLNSTVTYTAVNNTNYTFVYNSAQTSFYDTSIDQNQSGKYVKIGDNYYEITYKGTYSVSQRNRRHYTISGYNSTDNVPSKLYTRTETVNSLGGEFYLSVDGNEAKKVTINCAPATEGDNIHEFAYRLGLILGAGNYGAYCEVDPVTNKATIRSMQTGDDSSISITGLDDYVETAVSGCGDAWIERTIDSSEAGKYVAMTVDSNDGIHLAYHATGTSDLKYAYLKSVDQQEDPVVVTVDGYQQVGQYIDIATATRTLKNAAGQDVSCIVPFISYYNLSYADSTSAVKCAYLNKPLIPETGTATITSANAEGCVDEKFTGNWEVTNIPCATVPVQYRVNIGVKTNGDVIVSYLGDTVEYVKVW